MTAATPIIKGIVPGDGGREKNADWLSGYFHFPAMVHLDRYRIAIVEKWHSVAELLNPAK